MLRPAPGGGDHHRHTGGAGGRETGTGCGSGGQGGTELIQWGCWLEKSTQLGEDWAALGMPHLLVLPYYWCVLILTTLLPISLPPVLTPTPPRSPPQRIERNYNFVEISDWFATRSDLIFLLFDPAKLDISDEFRAVRGGAGQISAVQREGGLL